MRYEPTNEDWLWLARAVSGEGRPHQLVAQCLVNRFVMLLQRRKVHYPTLWEFVRAYSSPVNPRRMRGGDIWERLYAHGGEDDRRQLEAAHKRREIHCAAVDFPDHVLIAVERALLKGPVDLPPAVTDFAAHRLQPPDHLELAIPGDSTRNAFYRLKRTRWRGYDVHAVTVALQAPPDVIWGSPLKCTCTLRLGPAEPGGELDDDEPAYEREGEDDGCESA